MAPVGIHHYRALFDIIFKLCLLAALVFLGMVIWQARHWQARDCPSYLAYGHNPESQISHLTQNPAAEQANSNAKGKHKLILLWQHKWEDPIGPPFPLDATTWPQSCGEQLPCSVTADRSHVDSDAVVFSWRFTDASDLPESSSRRPSQRYVFFATESAARWTYGVQGAKRNSIAPDFFNWTMSYRTDSDIHFPYGFMERRNESLEQLAWERELFSKYTVDVILLAGKLPENENNFDERLFKLAETAAIKLFNSLRIRAKTKLAASLVANCETASSRRPLLIKALAEVAEIDQYGCWSKKQCPSTPETTCRQTISRDYFFFLAFENSLCRDYVTEKVFVQLELDVVPVVLSRAVASQAGVPDEAFIAVDDFKTIPELAQYLKYLSTNATAYAEYFRWKRFYRSRPTLYTAFSSPSPVCPMCELLRKQAEQIKRTDELIKMFKEMDKLLKWSGYFHDRQIDPMASETAFCSLCSALHNDSLPSKVIPDIVDWWIDQAKCHYLSIEESGNLQRVYYKQDEREKMWIGTWG